MPIEVLLVQALVLAFTAALWWIARRDLAARMPPAAPAAETAELEELCATLETLVTSLSRRVDALEAAVFKNSTAAEPTPSRPAENDAVLPAEAMHAAEAMYAESAPDPRYAPVYALLDAGIFDPVEIARRTGLGRGEVDLLLSLRDRHAR